MISGYSAFGFPESALHLFGRMLLENMQPDQATFLAILKVSLVTGSMTEGKLIHGVITEFGTETFLNVGSSLVDMYAEWGNLEDAYNIFFHLPERNIVTWTAMAAGCNQHGRGEETIQMFQQMQQEGIQPDRILFISVLQACSAVLGLNQGKVIHTNILDQGLELDNMVGSAIVEMYLKCGSFQFAQRIFAEMPRKSLVVWNIMIAGCAQHGVHSMVMDFFDDMLAENLSPDAATFVSLLSACSHTGNLEVGCWHFESMVTKYGIFPTLDHYMCMVDLLGRAGSMNDALDLLHTMPFTPCQVGWRSLLTHCRTWGEVSFARSCFDNLLLLDPDEPTCYALMSEVYANAGMWDKSLEIEEMRKAAALWKLPGEALIEVGEKVYSFTVGDKHESYYELSRKLKALGDRLRNIDHVPFAVERECSI
ncbi:hypothetical protein KP509_20G069700 [Ceratopteris richardii]|nr:hypothetical protein KP509_20G069700 [Ceratopteris richardii]